MKMLLLVSSLIMIAFVSSYVGTVEGQTNSPVLVIHKTLSPDTFDWSQEITVTLVVSNHGSIIANNVAITDFIPAGFTSKDAVDDTIIIEVDTISPGNEFTHSYSVEAIGELTSTEEIPINFPRATITYFGSHEFNVQSNKISATSQPSEEWWEIHTVEAITILLFVAFAFGAFGSTINWLNADNETKEARKMMEDPTKIWHHSLLGGAAGVLVLATFEGLSMMFSDGQLKLTPQNILVLIGTCFAAGFAPLAVIEKATKQWKTSSAQLENETKELERKLKEKEEATENQVSALQTELEKESKAKEDIEKKFKLVYDHLEDVKKKLGNLGE